MNLWIALDAGNVKRLLVSERAHLCTVAFCVKTYGVIVFNARMGNYSGKYSEDSAEGLRYSKSVVRLHYPTKEKMRGKPHSQRTLDCAHASGLRPHQRAPMRAHISQLLNDQVDGVLQIGSFGSF